MKEMPRPVGPSGNAPSRPSFVSGTADTMDQQIKKKKQEVYQQTLANLAKLQQDEGGGGGIWNQIKEGALNAGGLALSPLATVTDIVAKPFELIPGVPDFQPESVRSTNLLISGGKAVKHVGGDAFQLGRSIFTGKDTLSESPSAKAYQAGGGGLGGTLAAASPYLELGGYLAPMVGPALREAGMLAPKPTIFEPLTAKQVPETAPTTPYRTTRAALAEDMAVTAPETPAPAGRVAPGFVSPEPVAVGNVGTLPDGASVRLDAPEQSVKFVAAQGPLDQVPTQHLWQAISENAGEGKRYQIIGESGGHVGMTRYRDTATGQYLGLKYQPGTTPPYLMYPDVRIPGPLAEVLSNDVAVAIGFPDMNLQLISNGDQTMSIVTELAQSVYGTKIYDTFGLTTRPSENAVLTENGYLMFPKYGDKVSIDSRIRKAIFDELVHNTDNHGGNFLFAEQPDGSLSVIPIDNELTFESPYMPDWGDRTNLVSSEPFNWSVRNKFINDPDGLMEDIKQTIADVQKRLNPKARNTLEGQLKKRVDDLIERSQQFDTDDLEALLEHSMNEIDNFIAVMKTFSELTTEYLAKTYFGLIKQGIEQI